MTVTLFPGTTLSHRYLKRQGGGRNKVRAWQGGQRIPDPLTHTVTLTVHLSICTPDLSIPQGPPPSMHGSAAYRMVLSTLVHGGGLTLPCPQGLFCFTGWGPRRGLVLAHPSLQKPHPHICCQTRHGAPLGQLGGSLPPRAPWPLCKGPPPPFLPLRGSTSSGTSCLWTSTSSFQN